MYRFFLERRSYAFSRIDGIYDKVFNNMDL